MFVSSLSNKQTHLENYDKIWGFNPKKRKLEPEMIGLCTVITVNHGFKATQVQDKNSKKKNHKMDSLWLSKAWVYQLSSKFNNPKELLEKY